MNHFARLSSRILALLSLCLCVVALADARAGAAPTFTSLYSFSALSSGKNADGANPLYDSLVQGSNGNFYGTTQNGGASGDGTIFTVSSTGVLTTLVNFTGTNGSQPRGSLVLGSDGNYYGTTFYGGSSNEGTAFKMTPTGTLTTLVSFTGANGAFPVAGLVLGSDGNFYGTTFEGGSTNDGVVFKVSSAGALTAIVSFTGANGKYPYAGLIQASDGDFYGTTESGGSSSDGTVFKVTSAGTLTTLATFTGANGSEPFATLLQASDGNFYGTTAIGGSSNDGLVFKMTPAGALAPLVNFTGANGQNPGAALRQGRDGDFYGTTSYGGSANDGLAFKVTPAGVLTTLVTFTGANGANPLANLAIGGDGNFYGETYGGGANGNGTVFKITAESQVIYNFSGTNGSGPWATLIQGSDGNLYGSTSYGGSTYTAGQEFSGDGTMFKITPTGALTTLVDYTGSNGETPNGALVQASDGNFYGTTYYGGTSGNGTIFKLSSSGTLTTLYSFTARNGSGDNADGSGPIAGLLLGSDGNFYGTTFQGGASGNGTVFKVVTNGTAAGTTLTSLVSFTGTSGADLGARVWGALIQDSNGNFYGTTQTGGTLNNGTVYKISPTDAFTTLVNFTGTSGAALGSEPLAGLVHGSDGNFYGTTAGGGVNAHGTVFKMTPAGSLTTLVNFTGTSGAALGADPYSLLIQGNDGNFYGTTADYGLYGYGTVFKMTPSGSLTTLIDFDLADGNRPVFGLVQGSDGNLYGSTEQGGAYGDGTICRVNGEPVGFGSSESTSENTPVTFTVAFDDPSGLGIDSVAFPTAPSHGTIALVPGSITETGTGTAATGTATLTYTPASNYHGTDSLIYTVTGFTGTSVPQTVSVNVSAATVAVSSSANPSVWYQPLTFTATVGEIGSGPTPTGTATFTVTSPSGTVISLGTVTLNGSGSAQIAWAGGAQGSFTGNWTVNVAYSGDGTYLPTNGTLTQVINQAQTNTVLSVDNASPAVGQTINLTATVTDVAPSNVSPVNDHVQFYDGSTLLGTVNTSSTGVAKLPISTLTAGPHSLTATFVGADNRTSSTSNTVTVTVYAPPTITGFTPTSGSVGTTVTITGTNLTGATVVGFQGQHATSFTVDSSTQITTTVPAGAATGPIAVATPGGTAHSSASFTVVGPPSVTLMEGTQTTTQAPFSATATSGDGSALTYAWSVSPAVSGFASSGSIASGTAFTDTLTATAATSYVVTVTVTDAYSQTATASKTVTFIPVPTTVTVSPATKSLGENGTQTFTAVVADQFGAAFTPSSLVWSVSGGGTINSSTGAFTAGATPGTYTVTATAQASGAQKTGTASVTIYALPTVVLTEGTQTATQAPFSATATSGDGSALTYAWSVSPVVSGFASTGSAPSGTPFTDTLTVTTSGSYVVTVTVTDDLGQTATASKSVTFTITQTPTITGFSPTAGPVGTTVVITGTNFTGATVVGFQGQHATSFTVNSSTQITTTVPAGAATGPIAVATPGGTAHSSASFTVVGPPSVTLMEGTQTATQAPFSATATSGDGSALTYAWSVSPAVSGFASSGSVASGTAFTDTLTATAATSYVVTVTVTDAYSQTASASKTVTFSQVPTTATISPATASLVTGSTQSFTAAVKDQFGAALTSPSLTWSISAGSGSLSSTTSNPTTYTAPATAGTATVKVVDGAASATAAITITAGGTGGLLTGTAVLTTTASTVNLTTTGTTDWAHWGRGVPGLDHKASGGSEITGYTSVGTGAVSGYRTDLRTCSWTDGTPTASSTNGYGVQVSGTGDGFSITAPADTTTRTLVVYVGGSASSGKLVAHLSDGAAADYTMTSASQAGTYDVAYTLTYRAGSAGKALTVTWTLASGTGTVSLSAAALH